ncbi:MAG: hypothetical protein A3A73_05110 [Omnitrophica bacterium RIFCSPLOWO2_01_FULL_50_24]|nr:MAG: hypothetical protein A3A73_05110 [Omnitrophica bacterium RIFCSPLOWO2_01_FULL_50_24]
MKPFTAARTSDRKKVEQFIREHLDDLYGFALSLARNSSDAEDLVSEACLKALRHVERVTEQTNLKAWFFTVIRNQFISWWRQKKRRDTLQEKTGGAGFSLYDRVLDAEIPSLVQPSSSLDPKKLGDLVSDEVSAALDQLPPEYREVIFLADVQEFSYSEISNVLACPVGTVRSRLARARGLLQKRLWEYARRHGFVASRKK